MSWITILIVAGLAWLWWDGMGAKEQARAACKRLCRERDVLLLDDTVALVMMRLRRNTQGKLHIYRVFSFEFTTDGDLRYQGEVEMLGRLVLHIEMQPYRIH